MTTVNLDELSELLADEKRCRPAPWRIEKARSASEFLLLMGSAGSAVNRAENFNYGAWQLWPSRIEAEFVCSLRNNAPAMLQELKDARVKIFEMQAELSENEYIGDDALDDARDERDALRAQLATAHDDALEEAAVRIEPKADATMAGRVCLAFAQGAIRALKTTKAVNT